MKSSTCWINQSAAPRRARSPSWSAIRWVSLSLLFLDSGKDWWVLGWEIVFDWRNDGWRRGTRVEWTLWSWVVSVRNGLSFNCRCPYTFPCSYTDRCVAFECDADRKARRGGAAHGECFTWWGDCWGDHLISDLHVMMCNVGRTNNKNHALVVDKQIIH